MGVGYLLSLYSICNLCAGFVMNLISAIIVLKEEKGYENLVFDEIDCKKTLSSF